MTFYNALRVRSQFATQNYYSGPAYERAVATLRDAGVEMIELEESERARWQEAVLPLRERFIAQHEANGLPARQLIEDMRALATQYASLTNEELNERVRSMPVAGIIDL